MTKGVGLPAPFVALMRLLPAWRQLKSVAPTIPYDPLRPPTTPYDVAHLGGAGSGHPLDATRFAKVTAATLVMDGGKSPAWIRTAIRSLADILPYAGHRTLAGRIHVVKAGPMAAVLKEFFGS